MSAAVDVLVHYTSAAVVKTHMQTAVDAGVHVVIGSSGLTAGDYQDLDRLARDRGVGVIAAGNFSVLAAVLRRAASLAAQHLDHWEIIDYASDEKPDVPSGTSRELAETLAQVRAPTATAALSDLHGPVEARGAELAGTRIHSVRLPSFLRMSMRNGVARGQGAAGAGLTQRVSPSRMSVVGESPAARATRWEARWPGWI